MRYRYTLLLIFANLCSAARITNDHQAYMYCLNNRNVYIAIIWPIAQGMNEEIERLFNKYGKIIYKKRVFLTPAQALYLLKKAHPHIVDFQEHLNWYFPAGTFNKTARVFVIECSQSQAFHCKHAIRRLFSLQYRSIHVNDTYTETMELAQFFFRN